MSRNICFSSVFHSKAFKTQFTEHQTRLASFFVFIAVHVARDMSSLNSFSARCNYPLCLFFSSFCFLHV